MGKIQDAIEKIQHGRPDAGSSARISADRASQAVFSPQQLESTSSAGAASPANSVPWNMERLRNYGLVPVGELASRVEEQFRMIKRPLVKNARGTGAHELADGNLILVTGSLPAEGKSFCCVNLAMSLALEKEITVLLVDADIRSPSISSALEIEDRPGLTDILKNDNVGLDQCIVKTDAAGLDVLPAGSYDEHATELLSSRRMAALAKSLSRSDPNRLVVFDSSPLLVTTESRVLASLVGQVLLVVRTGLTPQDALTDAVEHLEPEKAINVLVNGERESMGMASYGSYSYGYGYGYGRGTGQE